MRSSSLAAKSQHGLLLSPLCSVLQNHCFSFIGCNLELLQISQPPPSPELLCFVFCVSLDSAVFSRSHRNMASKGDLGSSKALCDFIPQSFSGCLLHMCPEPGTHCAMGGGVWKRDDNTKTHYIFGSLCSYPSERRWAYLLIKTQHFLQFPLVSERSLLRGFKPE